jgi:type IV secretory pathway TrbF-like protein
MTPIIENVKRFLSAPSAREALPPYLAARQAALAEHEQLLAGNRLLRHAVAALALVSVGLLGLVYVFGTRPRAIPSVVAVDKAGSIVAVARPVQPGAPLSEENVVRYQLAQFIGDSRAVLGDATAMKEQIRRAYALARGQAGQVLNGWYKAHDPFAAGARGSVQVQVYSVLKLSPDSYEVHWTETPRDEQGSGGPPSQWRGVFRVETLPPDPDEILSNPLGLYVTQIDWQQERS